MDKNKRKLATSLWIAPVVTMVSLPAHGMTTDNTATDPGTPPDGPIDLPPDPPHNPLPDTGTVNQHLIDDGFLLYKCSVSTYEAGWPQCITPLTNYPMDLEAYVELIANRDTVVIREVEDFDGFLYIYTWP